MSNNKTIVGITMHPTTINDLPPGVYIGVYSGYTVTIPALGSGSLVTLNELGLGVVVTGPAYDIKLPEGIRGTSKVEITIGAMGKYTLTFLD